MEDRLLNPSKLQDCISEVSFKLFEMSLIKPAWVRLNRELALSGFGHPCINGVLRPLLTAIVVHIRKLQTTLFMHPNTGLEKDVVACHSEMTIANVASKTSLPLSDRNISSTTG